jgi:hypothetical protein
MSQHDREYGTMNENQEKTGQDTQTDREKERDSGQTGTSQ